MSSPLAEQDFQQAKLTHTRRRLRFVCAITAVAYLGAAYADSLVLANPAFSLLLAARCLTALSGMAPFALTFSKKAASSDLGLTAGAYMCILMGTECLELYLKSSGTPDSTTPITAFIILTFYLFQPPQIWQSIISGGLGSVGYITTMGLLTPTPMGHVVNTALVFGLANGFGLYYCIRFGAAQRREYVAMKELKRKAEIDALTGLLNRRRVDELCKQEFLAATQSGDPCSLLLLDIDNLKAVNNSASHHEGDLVLAAMAKRCSRVLRLVDVFGRIGGEEFAVFLPHATPDQARLAAERLRAAVGNAPFSVDGKSFSVTVSIGGAFLDSDKDTLDALFRRADDALHAAKRLGGNRTHF